MSPQSARVSPLVGRTAGLLLAVLLVLLHVGAFATSPEPLHLAGIQDGADYDSLIQPLVLALSGVPVVEVVMVTPAGSTRAPLWASVPAARPGPAARLPQPRAPPLD
jgi:hypothetical protein